MDILFFINLSGRKIVSTSPEICEMEPMGGSETAVIRLSAALRRLGHQIEIITTPEELKGRSCDVLVACRDWRAILLDSISAKLRYLWC